MLSSLKRVVYPSLEFIILTNKRALEFTGEEHGYKENDMESLKIMLANLRKVGRRESSFKQRMLKKSSFLMYRLARGQRFYEGNKRTAFMVTREFLLENGYTLPTSNRLGRVLTLEALDRPPLNSIEKEIVRLVK